MERPGKKPRACVPCHERKVRCDLALSGIPCTRCLNKDRVAECMPLSRSAPGDTQRRKRAAAIRNTGDEPPRKAAFNSTRDGSLGSAATIDPTEV
ncbi:unnamed protein product [Clonostachys solani]|uniref:Zn(2)-C6 fungal-type domain-containing protein n=1 Tax=Clonostachys solani TaxID=160281 RepID=A0A9N9Z8P1_9HYPO|nr:unnamed protein product [Clonostachys solani]